MNVPLHISKHCTSYVAPWPILWNPSMGESTRITYYILYIYIDLISNIKGHTTTGRCEYLVIIDRLYLYWCLSSTPRVITNLLNLVHNVVLYTSCYLGSISVKSIIKKWLTAEIRNKDTSLSIDLSLTILAGDRMKCRQSLGFMIMLSSLMDECAQY